MYAFVVSQFIGLTLFFTLNYGALSYIKYRKNQASNKSHTGVEVFFLQQARVAIYLFFVVGVAYKINSIHEHLNIDYSYLIFRIMTGGPDASLLVL